MQPATLTMVQMLETISWIILKIIIHPVFYLSSGGVLKIATAWDKVSVAHSFNQNNAAVEQAYVALRSYKGERRVTTKSK